MLEIRNPHSVLAALKTRPKDVNQIFISSKISEAGDDSWTEISHIAKTRGVPISQPQKISQHQSSGRHFGNYAIISAKSACDLKTLFQHQTPNASSSQHEIWIGLDCIQDPQNLGSIFRTAAFFGIRGIVMPLDRSAPLTATVYDVSAGGVEHVLFTIETNFRRALESAKEAGLWVLGTSEHARQNFDYFLTLDKGAPRRKWLLVLGNEEKGLRRLTLEACDMVGKIQSYGLGSSLNVAVTTAICLSKMITG